MKLACIQTNSTDDMAENIAAVEVMVREAAAQGCEFIALPENAFLMAIGERFHAQVFMPEENPALKAVHVWARELRVWILIGSIATRHSPLATKYYNRSYLISPDGIAAHYDKIHLFDVSVPGGESHQESARFEAGEEAVIAAAPWGKLGMTVCYDLRFPQLYRALARGGAEILAVPAAFTRFTGEKGGWHVLNRARAMETGCFVIAPAQCGHHAGGRRTYGHSLIVGPWGDVLAEAGDAPGILTVEIDLSEVARTRVVMPSLSHDREFTLAQKKRIG